MPASGSRHRRATRSARPRMARQVSEYRECPACSNTHAASRTQPYVELVLACYAVAHSYRCTVAVAGPAEQVALSWYVSPIDGEQCRQTRSLKAACVEQPPEEPAGHIELADPEERGNADAGVPGPRVAVVPVANTAGIFRQRRGGRGDRRSRGRVGQQPQGKQAADLNVTVGKAGVDLRAPGPSGPRPGRLGPRPRRDRRG